MTDQRHTNSSCDTAWREWPAAKRELVVKRGRRWKDKTVLNVVGDSNLLSSALHLYGLHGMKWQTGYTATHLVISHAHADSHNAPELRARGEEVIAVRCTPLSAAAAHVH